MTTADTSVVGVVVSDLHLGATQGLLLDAEDEDAARGAAPLAVAVECLRAIAGGDRPELILAGDVIELALRPPNVAFGAFRTFVELLYGSDDVVDRALTYVPGNHDHHLWELTRQQHWLGALEAAEDHLPAPRYATNLADGPLPLAGLPSVIRSGPGGPDVTLAAEYPNLLRTGPDGRAIVVHHGHFVEPMYRAMTTIDGLIFGRRTDHSIEELTEDNHAWIDFLWSALGTSGDVGTDLGSAYHLMPDHVAVRDTALRVVDRLGQAGGGHPMLRRLRQQVLRLVIHSMFVTEHVLETRRPREALSRGAAKGLRSYLDGPLTRQLSEQAEIPTHTTFVFGHTHKPFQDIVVSAGLGRVAVHNTGGWVNEVLAPQPTQGGQWTFLSDGGAAVSVELYRQSVDGGASRARVRTPLVDDDAHRRLATLLRDRLAGAGSVVEQLQQSMSTMVGRRRSELLAADTLAH